MSPLPEGASPDPPDLIVTAARLWDGSPIQGHDSVAVHDGMIQVVGTRRDVMGLKSGETRVIDAAGRRVMPGLIDSHIHMVRAGRTWNEEVRWGGLRSLDDGLDVISQRARAIGDGGWVGVIGDWHPHQFTEQRAPTSADLDEAAPDNPVFVQRNYIESFVNTRALIEMGWMDAKPEGRVTDPSELAALRARVATDDTEAMIDGTRTMLRELNRLGLTGAIDAAGFGMTAASYGPFFELFRRGERGFRARLLVGAARPGAEPEDYENWMKKMAPGAGDDLVRYLGAGELLLYAAHDMEGLIPKDVSTQIDDLADLSQRLLSQEWPVQTHAILDTSVSALLEAWERLSPAEGVSDLRFAICHADQVGNENLRRIRDLGIGLAIQNGMALRKADSAPTWTSEQLGQAPRLRTMLDLGIPVGAGTDATVVSSYNPWDCIYWMVTGEGRDGSSPRDEEQRLSLDEALRLYTNGSAWLSFEEETRGNLRPGSHADLVVLSKDPFAIATEELTSIESSLTMVGGEVAHSTGEIG